MENSSIIARKLARILHPVLSNVSNDQINAELSFKMTGYGCDDPCIHLYVEWRDNDNIYDYSNHYYYSIEELSTDLIRII